MRRLLLVLLVLPLAACSSTESRVVGSLAPKASVQRAATKTAAATSAHITLTGGTLAGSVTGSGDFDTVHHRGSFHLDLPRLGAMDAVVDGTTAYIKAPFLSAFLPPGKSWLKVSRNENGLNTIPDVIPQNPQVALARLKKLTNVRRVGDETIAGVSTTHYQGTVRRGGWTFDVWVGKDDGYVRRFQASGTRNVGAAVTFSDFGEPVSVTVPPASETVDATSLLPFFHRG